MMDRVWRPRARWTTILLLLVGASLAAMSASVGWQDAPVTFRGRADFVSVDVSVRRGGRPVTGLSAQDFEVLDNDVAQTVAELSYEKLPIDVTIALDTSNSVSGSVLSELRRSVTDLRANLRASDRLRLMTFNMRPITLVDFAEPPDRLDRALSAISTQGSSAVLDALALALTAPTPADRRQLIVLFSDGMDTTSVTEPADLLDLIHHTTPTIAVVLAGPPTSTAVFRAPTSTVSSAFRRVYDRLAAETGGLVVPVEAGDSIAGRFRRVLDEFRIELRASFRTTRRGACRVSQAERTFAKAERPRRPRARRLSLAVMNLSAAPTAATRGGTI